jgi:hypothetical protein
MLHIKGGGVGLLKKLYGLALWIRRSTLHSSARVKAARLQLGIDNATRWISWHHVLDIAPRKQSQI